MSDLFSESICSLLSKRIAKNRVKVQFSSETYFMFCLLCFSSRKDTTSIPNNGEKINIYKSQFEAMVLFHRVY